MTRREGLWAAGLIALEGPDTLPGVVPGVEAPVLPVMSVVEEAVADVWAHGVSVDRYPTVFVREGLDRNGVLTVAGVLEHEAERRVSVAGVVTHRQRPGTAKGVTFISLEDETGFLNVICSQGVWRRYQAVARRAHALVIRGRIERADGATNLVAEHLAPLSLKVACQEQGLPLVRSVSGRANRPGAGAVAWSHNTVHPRRHAGLFTLHRRASPRTIEQWQRTRLEGSTGTG